MLIYSAVGTILGWLMKIFQILHTYSTLTPNAATMADSSHLRRKPLNKENKKSGLEPHHYFLHQVRSTWWWSCSISDYLLNRVAREKCS